MATTAARAGRGVAVFVVAADFTASIEYRHICREAAASGLIALIMCDGSSESAWHAEPDEAQMPCSCSGDGTCPDSIGRRQVLARDRVGMAM